ncbi:hypothetical protein [Acanthopleuribacter pedis]|uniref:Uncharacterized protein n=1 Tax=Acanthopleuribacter pedis TaxID=442870 RepID=A0A8J7Q6T1_9BACT|nr:hypothetical protein [Acanthopleuribacter pedis]MBO1321607.1 hypothetical protein [Acanthopleuribacter pedis]
MKKFALIMFSLVALAPVANAKDCLAVYNECSRMGGNRICIMLYVACINP